MSWTAAQPAQAPRRETITVLPSTSISSMSPPSFRRVGRISRSKTSSISLIFWILVSLGRRRRPAWLRPAPVQDLLDRLVALAAAAAGLGVVGDLLDGRQVVLLMARPISTSVTPKHSHTTSPSSLGNRHRPGSWRWPPPGPPGP